MRLFLIRKNFGKCKIRMVERAKQFAATGSEIYHGNLPEGAKEHH